jgi:hypothetical protein
VQVDLALDLGEQVLGRGVARGRRRVDRLAVVGGVGGEPVAHQREVGVAVDGVERVLGQRGGGGAMRTVPRAVPPRPVTRSAISST